MINYYVYSDIKAIKDIFDSFNNQQKINFLENAINDFTNNQNYLCSENVHSLELSINLMLYDLDLYKISEDFADGSSINNKIVIRDKTICFENEVSYINLFEILDFIYKEHETKLNILLIDNLFIFINNQSNYFKFNFETLNLIETNLQRLKLFTYKIE